MCSEGEQHDRSHHTTSSVHPTCSDEVHFHRALQMRTTHITEEGHFAVPARLDLLPRPRERGHVLNPVHQYVRMGIPPDEGSELNSTYVESESLHLVLAVLTIDDAHELEHFRSCSTAMMMMVMYDVREGVRC